jgi:hypothetical protein
VPINLRKKTPDLSSDGRVYKLIAFRPQRYAITKGSRDQNPVPWNFLQSSAPPYKYLKNMRFKINLQVSGSKRFLPIDYQYAMASAIL